MVHARAFWQTIFLGSFPDISSGKPTGVSEWSILWPIIASIAFVSSFLAILKRETEIVLKGVVLFVFFACILFTRIPFYPRYLMIVLPFFYLFSILIIEKLNNAYVKKIIYAGVLLFALGRSISFMIPSPDGVLSDFYYNFSHFYFQDIYQQDIQQSSSFSRQSFRLMAQTALNQAAVREVQIKELKRNIPLFGNSGNVRVLITYKTQDLGVFSEEKIITLKKIDQRWRIDWKWGYLLNQFAPGDTLTTQTIPGRRGSVFSSNTAQSAIDTQGYLILVNPEKIDTKREESMLKLISRFSLRPPIFLQNAYLENPLPNENIALTTLFKKPTDSEIAMFLSYPGLTLKPYRVRLYNGMDPKTVENTVFEECCTSIYSPYAYHGIKGTEKQYDKSLFGYDGGIIEIKDRSGNVKRIVLKKNKKDGADVIASNVQ